MDLNALIAELRNVGMFIEVILMVLVYTGLIVVILVALGYELQTKGGRR